MATDEAEATASMLLLIGQVPQADTERLLRAFDEPAQLAPKEACWAMRTVYGAFAKLSPEDRLQAARILP